MNEGSYEFLAALCFTWLIQAIVAALIVGPVVFITRKKLAWRRADMSSFILPWLTWFLVYILFSKYGSLTTALFANLLMGCAVGVGFIVFAVLAKHMDHTVLRRSILAGLIGCAVLLWTFIPQLGE